MRKLIVLSFISLDGVMQAPGGPEEDPTGGFKHEGWIVGYLDDFLGTVLEKQISKPFDLLLGRKTYEIFAAHWPYMNGSKDPFATRFNNAKKYVASKTLTKHDLVDELWLKIFPITLGKGKRLFAEGTVPAGFKLLEGEISPSGVIIASYERAGEVKTGSFGLETPSVAELARRKRLKEEG